MKNSIFSQPLLEYTGENISSCFFAYRAGKVLRLHLPNGKAAASGLVDTGDGHKGLGIDLCDQIVELV